MVFVQRWEGGKAKNSRADHLQISAGSTCLLDGVNEISSLSHSIFHWKIVHVRNSTLSDIISAG